MDVMLTTKDNPFNPFTEWNEWYAYDAMVGHHTPGYLARIARTTNEVSPSMIEESIIEAMDEIVEMNPLGIYTKISRETET